MAVFCCFAISPAAAAPPGVLSRTGSPLLPHGVVRQNSSSADHADEVVLTGGLAWVALLAPFLGLTDLRCPGAIGFDVSGATPETVNLVRSYLSSLRVEILTDRLLRNVAER